MAKPKVNVSNDDDVDTSQIAQTLGVIEEAYIFKIPPKPSAMGHIAENWPKKAMWVGKLKIVSTATECILQFINIETDKIYLSVPIENDEDKPSTIEPAYDSSRYYALTILKPNTTNQYFELGLGFQTREDSSDFRLAVAEFKRYQNSLKEAQKFKIQPKNDFSIKDDEVFVMKSFKGKKKSSNNNDNNVDPTEALNSFAPPPSDKAKKSKKKKTKQKKPKKTNNNNDNNNNDTNNNGDNFFGDDFGDFTNDTNNNDNSNANADANQNADQNGDDWAQF